MTIIKSKIYKLLINSILYASIVLISNRVTAQPLAFPSAVGFGKNVTGGRGGTVYRVTNLNDSGPGSFRDAVSASNRIVVFDVSGYITLKTAVSAKSNLTIAGQTAPGEGIGFRGGKISFGTQSNIIMRYIRIRPGSEVASTGDVGINLLDAKNVIVDHCSIEFAPWNNIGGVSTNWQTKPVENITFQNCLIANPTYQQFGAHIECPNGTWTWAYNIFANSHNRNPLDKINDIFINNVLYNCSAGYTTHTSTNFKHDIIGNYFIKGPASTGTDNQWYQVDKNQSIYYNGNLKDSNLDGILNGTSTTPAWYQGPGTILTAPWSTLTAGIPAYSAATAYRYTASVAGTFPHDEMDRLVMSQIRTLGKGTTGTGIGTCGPGGGLYTTQTQTGLGNNGYGTIVTGTKPTDTDGDGMPDFWERTVGSNPASNDAMQIETDGYTRIEKYINWLADVHTKTLQNTAIDLNLSKYAGGFENISSTFAVSNPKNGSVSLLSDGKTARFTPAANFYGIANYKFTIKGIDGTSYTFDVAVLVEPSETSCSPPAAVISASGVTTFCYGNTVTLNANTGSGLTYQWKIGLNTINGATNASYKAVESGSYSVVVTKSTNCSATSSAIPVTVNTLPTISITTPATTVIPNGGTILLKATTGNGFIYQWKINNITIGGATSSSYSVNTAGTYTVVVTTSCSATSIGITITNATSPKKYIYTYDNSGNLSWTNTNSWTPKGIPTAIDSVIIRTGEVQIDALTHTAPVYIETNGTLRLLSNSAIDNLHLQGGTIKVYTNNSQFDLQSTITVDKPSIIMSGLVGATVFALNGKILGAANLTKTSFGVLMVNSDASSYKGKWIVEEGKLKIRSMTGMGSCGVQVKAKAILDIETAAAASIYSLEIDSTGSVDLDADLSTEVAVFGSYNISSGSFLNTNYPTYIGSTGTLKVTKNIVTLSGIPTFCLGNTITLTATPSASYSWKNNTSTVATSAAYTTNQAGYYNVDITNASGCKVRSATIKTVIDSPITITQNVKVDDGTWTATTATSVCIGSVVNLGPWPTTATGWKWTGPNNLFSTLREQVLTNISAIHAGIYTATFTDPNGCKTTSTFTLQVNALPTATISAPTTTICAGNSVLLTANTGTSYKWFKGASQVGTASTLSVTETGAYTVEVTNNSGCKAVSAVKQINVTNATTWYADTDNDGKGDAISTLLSCTQPHGYVAVSGDACPTDAAKTTAGNCGCGKTETECLDCAGIPNGTAVFDNCNICVGGITGNKECISTGTINGTNNNITVVPQPFDVTTHITIANLGIIQTVTIISANGAVVEIQRNINTTEISIGDQLAAGLYSVIIQTDKGVYTTKIVKK